MTAPKQTIRGEGNDNGDDAALVVER